MSAQDWKISQKLKANQKIYDPQLISVVGVLTSEQFDILLSIALDNYRKSNLCPTNCLSRKFNYSWIYKSLNDINNQHTGYGLVWVNHPSLSWLLLGLNVDGKPCDQPNQNEKIENSIKFIEHELIVCNWQEKSELQTRLKNLQKQLCAPLRLNTPEYNEEQKIRIQQLKHLKRCKSKIFSITGWVKSPINLNKLQVSVLYAKLPKDSIISSDEIMREYLMFHSPNQQKKLLGPEVYMKKISGDYYYLMKFSSAERAIFAYNIKQIYKELVWNYIPLELYN